MCNPIASSIFCIRNLKKAKDNPIRGGVAVANGTKVAGQLTQSAAVHTAANIAGKVVNPLIVASCVYQTAKSDDKIKEGVSNAGALAGMFFFENQMKKGVASELVNKGANKLMSVLSKNAKVQSAGVNVLTGLAFVGASIAGWALGEKAGTSAIDLIRESDPEKIELKKQSDSSQGDSNQTENIDFLV